MKVRKVFFDIGPREIGTEAWADKWSDYQIIGFEPDPDSFSSIVNEFPGILLNYAVSNKNGIAKGQLSPGGFCISGAALMGDKWIKVKTITLDTIDELFGGFNECRIWADIEGSELRMLKGAENVLKKTDWILLEVRQIVPHDDWCKAEEVYEFLGKRGFKPDVPLLKWGRYDVIFTK